MPSAATIKLAEAKLAESGLTLEDAKQLGLTFHDNLHDLDEVFDAVPGIRFEYKSVLGAPLEARAGWGPVWRARQLSLPPEELKGFDKQTTGEKLGKDGKKLAKKKDRRYLQPKNSAAAPYFPSIGVDWPDVVTDYEYPIIMTEGEFKAAKCCKEGFATIGLGGVWNFKSTPNGYIMLPGLLEIEWKYRKVYIIYDSDVRSNPQMLASIREVAEQLYLLGAIPYCVFLPALGEEGSKTGLDDFLVHENGGPEELQKLIDSCQDTLEMTREAWAWNEKYVHITLEPHCLVDRGTGKTYKVDDYIKAHQTQNYVKRVLDSNGETRLEQTSLAQEIFKWPLHATLDKVVYDPSSPALQELEEDKSFNLWPGWGVEPVKGDVQLAYELIDHLFGNDTQEAKWFLAWLAYQVQHPGTKLSTAILLIGMPGCGKSMLAQRVMQKIFGRNYRSVEGADFFSPYNEWALKSQFVLADECLVKGDRDNRAHGAALRNYVTRDIVTINEKYGLRYSIKDCCNIYMTSNYMDGIPILNKERRYFIYKTEAGRIGLDFKQRWDKWKNNGGIEAFFYHLLHEVDTSWFDPHGEAPETQGFHDVQDHLRSDTEEIASHIIANGLYLGQMPLSGDVWSMQDIFARLTEDQRSVIRSPAQLKKALLSAGAKRLLGPLADGRFKINGQTTWFYTIRNQDKWVKASPEDVRRHVADSIGITAGSKF